MLVITTLTLDHFQYEQSITSQPNINILFCRSGITRLHKENNNNKFQGNHFVPIIPVGAGCKRKQNPLSIETKSKFTSLKEWSIASQSRICFSLVSKPTISLEKFLRENITDITNYCKITTF